MGFFPKTLNSLYHLMSSPVSKRLISYTSDIYSDITPTRILDNYHAKRIFCFRFYFWPCACSWRLYWFKSQWPWLICEGQLTLKQECSKIPLLLTCQKKGQIHKMHIKAGEKGREKEREEESADFNPGKGVKTKRNISRNKIHWVSK